MTTDERLDAIEKRLDRSDNAMRHVRDCIHSDCIEGEIPWPDLPAEPSQPVRRWQSRWSPAVIRSEQEMRYFDQWPPNKHHWTEITEPSGSDRAAVDPSRTLVAASLRIARIRLGFSLRQFAEHSVIVPSRYAEIESGRDAASKEETASIICALKHEFEWVKAADLRRERPNEQSDTDGEQPIRPSDAIDGVMAERDRLVAENATLSEVNKSLGESAVTLAARVKELEMIELSLTGRLAGWRKFAVAMKNSVLEKWDGIDWTGHLKEALALEPTDKT